MKISFNLREIGYWIVCLQNKLRINPNLLRNCLVSFCLPLTMVCSSCWNYRNDLFLLSLRANRLQNPNTNENRTFVICLRFWAKNFHLYEQWLENMNVVLYIISLIENWVWISGRAAKIFALSYSWIAEKRQTTGDSFRIWTRLLLGAAHPSVSIDLPPEQRTELQSYKSGVGNIFTELANKIHSKICVVLLRSSTISASFFLC